MNLGPFKSKDGSNVIMYFVKDEVIPSVQRIEDLAVEVSKFRIGFRDAFTRLKISNLEEKYKQESLKFMEAYKKWSNPDILFGKIDDSVPGASKPEEIMVDYFISQQAIMLHFNEGFRLLGYIDSMLNNQGTAAYNRVSITLAILAIVVSLIVAIL